MFHHLGYVKPSKDELVYKNDSNPSKLSETFCLDSSCCCISLILTGCVKEPDLRFSILSS